MSLHLFNRPGSGLQSGAARLAGPPQALQAARALTLVLGLAVLPPLAAQGTEGACGNPFSNGTAGPFDYRVEQGAARRMVESNHFTPNVESLVRGNTGSVGSEITFTLRAFPNHHRALVAMMNLGEKLKTNEPRGAGYSVECFFIRALTFRPDDTVARMIYAKFLASKGRKPEALSQLESTTQQAGDNGFTHYNLGLIYLELNEFDRALAQAHRALALGFAKTELQQRLQAAGKWREPAAESPAAAPSAAAS